MNICSKNHARAMESMQASLEFEQNAKSESLRNKKNLEAEINDLEIALDHANKANNEAQKSIKRYQQKLSEATSVTRRRPGLGRSWAREPTSLREGAAPSLPRLMRPRPSLTPPTAARSRLSTSSPSLGTLSSR